MPEESGVAAVEAVSSGGLVSVGSGVSAGGLLGAADEGEGVGVGVGVDELLALALALALVVALALARVDADADGEEEGLAAVLPVDFPPPQAASPSPSTRAVGRISIRARGACRRMRPAPRRMIRSSVRDSRTRSGEAISVDVIDHHHHPCWWLFQPSWSPFLSSQPC